MNSGSTRQLLERNISHALNQNKQQKLNLNMQIRGRIQDVSIQKTTTKISTINRSSIMGPKYNINMS